MHAPEIPGFRSVPFTGVIYVMAEATWLGYRYGHPDWCNLGQGMPEAFFTAWNNASASLSEPNAAGTAVAVTVNSDAVNEGDESFSVTLSGPAGATIVDGTGAPARRGAAAALDGGRALVHGVRAVLSRLPLRGDRDGGAHRLRRDQVDPLLSHNPPQRRGRASRRPA